MFKLLICVTAGALIALSSVCAQLSKRVDTEGKTEVEVVPGAHYEANWFHRIFFGDHWRSLWTTPLKVDVLDLERFAGGLSPLKRGGGLQTKSLRLLGADGLQYKFRSLDKDPTAVMPKILRRSVAADIIQDQISTANPIAPLIATPILNAVGVLNATPTLVVLPNSDKLGEFREEFGGLLGTLELHPEGASEDDEGFAGSEKVKGTFKLFDRLEEKQKEGYDSKEFLKARLLDIFLGDWDRHTDQWRWARFEENGKRLWKPIPRDRDQAFCRYDGLFPWIAAQAVTQIEGFGPTYPKIADLTWSGRFLDRRILPQLTKAEWDSISTYVDSKLTDEVIENAVRGMPDEWYALEGERLTEELKIRKQGLLAASEQYFEDIMETVDIYGTNKGEFVEVRRLDDQRVETVVRKRDKSTGEGVGEPLFSRVFNTDLTCEIRLHLLDGADKVVVSGEVESSLLVTIVGGRGADEVVDSSIVEGDFLGFIPFIPDAETKTRIYDSGKKTELTLGPSATVNREKVKPPADLFEKYEPQQLDRGFDWRYANLMGFNSDEGILFGGGAILYRHDFRVSPHVYRLELVGGVAPFINSFLLDFKSEFFTLIGGAKTSFRARTSEIEITSYYGLGNETEFSDSLDTEDFYKVEQREYLLQSELTFPLSDDLDVGFGAELKFSNIKRKSNTLLDSLTDPEQLRGVGDVFQGNIHGGLVYDSRNFGTASTRGALLEAHGAYYPKLFDNDFAFGKVSAEGRVYLTETILTPATLALRARGEKIWGTFPFYEAAFIGGVNSLRGYSKQRFAGDASALGSADLRLHLADFYVLVPGQLGVTGFAEAGRVFLDGEDSETWYKAYGYGVSIQLVSPAMTLSITTGISDETTALYIISGFSF